MHGPIYQLSKRPIAHKDYYIPDSDLPSYMNDINTNLSEQEQEEYLCLTSFPEMEVKGKKLMVGSYRDFKKRYVEECRILLGDFKKGRISIKNFYTYTAWADEDAIFYLDGSFYKYMDIMTHFQGVQFYIGMIASYNY